MSDPKTLAVYAAKAQDYADCVVGEPGDNKRRFEEALPRGAVVLDLGCGPGQAAAYFAAQGHQVRAWDAVPEMVEMAKDHPGVETRLATFEDLPDAPELDGLWISFSLLHAPRADFPRHIATAISKVRPGGIVYLGMKLGTGEGPDNLGRHYAYYSEEELIGACTDNGVTVIWQKTGEEAGLSGEVASYLLLLGRKDG